MYGSGRSRRIGGIRGERERGDSRKGGRGEDLCVSEIGNWV